jgi:mannose PTS system EIIA component
MIGILLLTHGNFGEALLQNACHVLNRCPPQFAQFGLAAQDDPLDVLPLVQDLLQQVDGGDGVLILTDIYGATPSNLAFKLLQPGRIEAVAGVSLPMLLRALTYREKDMETMLIKAVSGARDGALNIVRDL